jgi:peptide/nickel transport system substrate-binding protein
MKRTFSLLLAAASLLLVAQPFLAVAVLHAAERPRYGGTLRIEMQAALDSLDPRAQAATPQQAEAKARLASLAFEGLVGLDDAGRVQPLLALSWQHDAEYKQWQFRLRPGVKFHDGSELTPSVAADALEAAKAPHHPEWRIRVFGETIVIQTPESTPGLLMLLSEVSFAIQHPRAESPVGTGPFRVTRWEARQRAIFTAFDEYWGGRPFVDSIEVRMDCASRDQLADFELGQADVVEVPPAQVRSTTQSGGRVWSSAPAELVVLAPPDPQQWRKPREVYQALALSIDRAAIHSVLLQKQGEPTGALLPEWFTGYAFLFDAKRDLERARQMLAESGVRSGPILLEYDTADDLLRAIAERIAVNARDAGLTVQPLAASGREELSRADLVLVRMNPVSARDWAGGAALIAPVRSALVSAVQTADPYRAYAAERESVENAALAPLFHLPVSFGIGGRVRNWQATRWGEWRLADVWLVETTESTVGARHGVPATEEKK